jgi:hypothetical protein
LGFFRGLLEFSLEFYSILIIIYSFVLSFAVQLLLLMASVNTKWACIIALMILMDMNAVMGQGSIRYKGPYREFVECEKVFIQNTDCVDSNVPLGCSVVCPGVVNNTSLGDLSATDTDASDASGFVDILESPLDYLRNVSLCLLNSSFRVDGMLSINEITNGIICAIDPTNGFKSNIRLAKQNCRTVDTAYATICNLISLVFPSRTPGSLFDRVCIKARVAMRDQCCCRPDGSQDLTTCTPVGICS